MEAGAAGGQPRGFHPKTWLLGPACPAPHRHPYAWRGSRLHITGGHRGRNSGRWHLKGTPGLSGISPSASWPLSGVSAEGRGEMGFNVSWQDAVGATCWGSSRLLAPVHAPRTSCLCATADGSSSSLGKEKMQSKMYSLFFCCCF